MIVDAVVLAGADNQGKLAGVSSAAHEALIAVAGRPMVHYVIEALKEAKSVRRIIVVGPVNELSGDAVMEGVELVERAGSMVSNLKEGIDHLRPEGPVLVVTSDIPLIRAEAIDDFIARSEAAAVPICYPIVRKETNEARFPGVKRTYVQLKDGVFTGGNLALLDPKVIPACQHFIEQAVAMRKKPWKLSRMLGVAFIVKLLLNRLSLAEIEARVEHLLGFKGKGIESPYPEVGIDVDKPEDLELVERALSRAGREDA